MLRAVTLEGSIIDSVSARYEYLEGIMEKMFSHMFVVVI